ncbi:MAG: SDR family oxidoreductase [Gemmatimonadota bacterium]|nr:SDR family oxidoreductase [Gemmatimonadota bacterium]
MESNRVLVTGATGYIGGRLVRRLWASGRPVRAMARSPENLRSRVPSNVSIVRGDVLDPESLTDALEGIHTAYYLIHSMGSADDFEDTDRRGAENFARAAEAAGVERIIYMGGLGRGQHLSPHLRSRQEVGRILRESTVPTLEFRSSIVIGSGSLSFELVRALTERLPVMLTPSWVRLDTQPIAVEDLLDYLVAALRHEPENEVVEVGGADVVSYGDLMSEYASLRGLRRLMIPVPVLTPRLSSLWLGLVTPVFSRIGKKLIEGLRNETVVGDPGPARRFGVEPLGVRDAMLRALANEDREVAETRWSDAVSAVGPPRRWGGVSFGNRIVDSRTASTPARPPEVWAPIRQLGGRAGWYYATWLWRLRGAIDLLLGGPGFRRGRPHPDQIRVGDTIDFWRVEAIDPARALTLRAEMRLPGRAWLQFEVVDREPGSEVRQTAVFDPIGVLGRLYWYGLYPLHSMIFRGMLREVVARAEREPRTFAPASEPELSA